MNLAAPLTDKANALECAAACSAVYDVCSLQTEDCHIFLSESETCVRVDVRGSKSAQDWINDLDFRFVDTIYGKVHRGFWQSSALIFPNLKSQLRAIPKPIVIDGHSLGAAQGTLFALDLITEKFPVECVTLFGSPRVGDVGFKALYDRLLGSKTIRYVNALDVVSRMPFSDLGYIHVGQEGYLPSSGALEVNPTFYQLLHDDVVGVVSNIRNGDVELLRDHCISSYQARILSL